MPAFTSGPRSTSIPWVDFIPLGAICLKKNGEIKKKDKSKVEFCLRLWSGEIDRQNDADHSSEDIESSDSDSQHRLVVKKGPMETIKFDGEQKSKKRQTYLVIDGMHRITYMRQKNGMVRGEKVTKYPADVYSETLPLKLMITYAAGNYYTTHRRD